MPTCRCRAHPARFAVTRGSPVEPAADRTRGRGRSRAASVREPRGAGATRGAVDRRAAQLIEEFGLYVHLRAAQVWTDSNPRPKALWRVRLSQVGAWHFGSLGVGEQQ